MYTLYFVAHIVYIFTQDKNKNHMRDKIMSTLFL